MDPILKIPDISPKISKKKNNFKNNFLVLENTKKHVFFQEFHLILGCGLTL